MVKKAGNIHRALREVAEWGLETRFNLRNSAFGINGGRLSGGGFIFFFEFVYIF